MLGRFIPANSGLFVAPKLSQTVASQQDDLCTAPINPNIALARDRFHQTTLLFIFLGQAALLVAAALQNLNVINPDAVSYLRAAQHYLDGNTRLAVNGYWGPLFSWLLVPCLALGAAPLTAARIVMGASAVVFLFGSVRLFKVMLWQPSRVLLSSALTAIFTAHWSVFDITPDLLMSGLLLLGISKTIEDDLKRRQALAAGLFYGFAYLAKSVALPVSLVLIILLPNLRAAAGSQPVRTCLRRVSWTLLGFTLIALPWIILLSRHYGYPTFSTAASINHALVGPGDLAQSHAHVMVRSYIVPALGRISFWEDPDPRLYDTWSAFSNFAMFKHQLRVMVRNLIQILINFRSMDPIGLGLVSCLFGFFFSFSRLRKEKWRLAAPLVAVTAGIYLPVYAEDLRYYIICYPIFIAAAFGFADRFSAIDSPIGDPVVVARRSIMNPTDWRSTIAAALVTACFSFSLISDLRQALRKNESLEYAFAQRLSNALHNAPPGPLVSVGDLNDVLYDITLYVAFLTERQYYGNEIDAWSLGELRGGYYLVVRADTTLDRESASNAQAKRFFSAPSSDRSLNREINVYFVKAP